MVVRVPAGPGSSRSEVDHVCRPGGVTSRGLHGGQGGVVLQGDRVVVVGGRQDVVVVEGDEGVVGTGQTVHTVAVICKYGELDHTL